MWQIRLESYGGSRIPETWDQPVIWQIFPQKLLEIRKIGRGGGGGECLEWQIRRILNSLLHVLSSVQKLLSVRLVDHFPFYRQTFSWAHFWIGNQWCNRESHLYRGSGIVEQLWYQLPKQGPLSICLTSLTRAKCGVRSTLCWKIPNISGSIELFAL